MSGMFGETERDLVLRMLQAGGNNLDMLRR